MDQGMRHGNLRGRYVESLAMERRKPFSEDVSGNGCLCVVLTAMWAHSQGVWARRRRYSHGMCAEGVRPHDSGWEHQIAGHV